MVNVATTRIVVKKEMVLFEEARDVLTKALDILANIPEEWDEDYPCFEQAYEALDDLLREDKFEIMVSKEGG